MKQRSGLKNKEAKEKFLELYKKNACNISVTCSQVGVSRRWYYENRKKDSKFEEELASMEEEMIDFAETQLFRNIKEGKETSLIFFLKCKAKSRGYIERQEIDHSGNIDSNVTANVSHNFSNLSTKEIKEILGKK